MSKLTDAWKHTAKRYRRHLINQHRYHLRQEEELRDVYQQLEGQKYLVRHLRERLARAQEHVRECRERWRQVQDIQVEEGNRYREEQAHLANEKEELREKLQDTRRALTHLRDAARAQYGWPMVLGMPLSVELVEADRVLQETNADR